MADSLVVQVMRRHKAALLAREAAQMREMARRWLEVEAALEGQLSALAQETAGQPLTQGQLYRKERFQTLLVQARREMERYAGYAEGLITQTQREYGRLGLQHAAEAVQTTFLETGKVGPYFNRLPIEALELTAGLAGDGSPLRKLLMDSWPEVADGLTRSLLKGVALGWGPAKTAKAMREQMATGLERALTIARTEQMRVYRAASDQQYQESGVVQGKRRLVAAFGACAACLARDGELLPLDEPAYDHPNGRCTFIPVVDGMPAPQWQKGPEWFKEQPAEYQRKILGPGRYEAWKAGKFDFADLARDSKSEVWGRSLGVRPLKELVDGRSGGAAKAVADNHLPLSETELAAYEQARKRKVETTVPEYADRYAQVRPKVAQYVEENLHLGVEIAPERLESILSEGLKPALDQASMTGTLAKFRKERVKLEREHLGLGDKHPIYGTWTVPGDWHGYGPIRLELDHTRLRTLVTKGDSLENPKAIVYSDSAAKEIATDWMSKYVSRAIEHKNVPTLRPIAAGEGQYIEAQILTNNSPLPASLIKRIWYDPTKVSSFRAEAIRKSLAERGLAVEVRPIRMPETWDKIK